MQELKKFIEEWEDTNGMKGAFLKFKELLESQDSAELEFNARPGVSYSLRAKHPAQTDRPLYVMVDVVDDDPADRWLSVCFYGDMITDPDEEGDLIPEGLLGQDGYCFDADDPDPAKADYIAARIAEAYASARK
ncbi:conserved hypothetical protein [Desulfatibacillum aliphaticivorans]|uniref:Uncharacterized protein n=1 Tax=Desulfatibacillum aliphaticivorans TaxID=218208 RepID=B8FM44_DESAL|nr:hypothetical protein [Desulfatibacillum aliphaticivorans]ACL05777.1 conserved hypothetical protein [Desulfatibacillum aliphaticivorans]